MQISAQGDLAKAAAYKDVTKQVKDGVSGAIKEVEKRTSVGVDVGAANGIGAKGPLSKNLAGDVEAKGSLVIGEGVMIGAFATYDVLSFEVPAYKESAFSIESAELNVAFVAGFKIRLEADVAGRMVLSVGPSGGFGALVHTTPENARTFERSAYLVG
jgi:hypothetical protein